LDSGNPFPKDASLYHSSIGHAHYALGSLTEMTKLLHPQAYQKPSGVCWGESQ